MDAVDFKYSPGSGSLSCQIRLYGSWTKFQDSWSLYEHTGICWSADTRVKKLRGMLMTRAQLMTRNVSALYIQSSHPASRPMAVMRTRGGSKARGKCGGAYGRGVDTRIWIWKSSDLDLRELAFSTRSSIFDTVDSPNSLTVRIFSRPVILMHPLMISSLLYIAGKAFTGQCAGIEA